MHEPQRLAEVAAAALSEDGHSGRIHELSGPRPLTFEDAVGEVARAAGLAVRFVPVTVAEYEEYLVDRGYPADLAALLGGLFEAVARGGHARLSDGVQQVLGREPRDFSTYVAAAAASGVWTTT